ncbi:hypothetical protein GOBAR_AA07874 [Gossypium barbadense]|uniref:Uncharacterized protein n=1 Tax=Gossypium barbadense TaxID=3634 RepID=A0A2P5YB03_GOSBA|nr:hypothetical protein GOBAR_AA07874 [Gossypium barbadense]
MDDFEEGKDEESKEVKEGVESKEVKEGVASIALLPNGSLSGHFIQLPQSICYGLHGTGTFQVVLTYLYLYAYVRIYIRDGCQIRILPRKINKKCNAAFNLKCHKAMLKRGIIRKIILWWWSVEGMMQLGSTTSAMLMVGRRMLWIWLKKKILVSFECETLKSDKAAEEHIKQFMPKLSGLDAVEGIGSLGKSLGSVVLQAADPVSPNNQRWPYTHVQSRCSWLCEPGQALRAAAYINIGRMSISGVDSEAETADSKQDLSTA